MYLRDYLHDIPLRALKAMADALDIRVEYRARIKLINAIDNAFLDGALVRKILGRLTDDQRSILAFVAFSFDDGASEHRLIAKAEKLLGFPARKTLDIIGDLIPLALVGGIPGDDNRYFTPGGIGELVRRELLKGALVPSGRVKKHDSFLLPNLIEDIVAFLAHAYKDRVPVTLVGSVRKVTMGKIFEGSLTTGNATISLTPDRRNSLVVDYLRARGLVTFSHREVTVTSLLGGWLGLPMTERIGDVAAFVLEWRLRDRELIVPFVNILREMPTGKPVCADEFGKILHTYTLAPGGHRRIHPAVNFTLSVFHHLGLIGYNGDRFVMTESARRFLSGERIPIESNTGTFFTVQPNFEIIVGPEFQPRTRFLLELMSSRVNRDMVMTYRITHQGIARARERGMSTESILTFFRDHSRNTVPQNVTFSIRQWAEAYGSIYFERAVLMRFRTPGVLDLVVHSPATAPFVVERLSDTALIVHEASIPSLTAELRRMGQQPEPWGETDPDPVLNGGEFRAEPLLEVSAWTTREDDSSAFIFPPGFASDEPEPAEKA